MRYTIGVRLAIATLLACSAASLAKAATLIVCPGEGRTPACQFRGNGGIQAAVDRASNGDTILIKAGRYVPGSHRDVRHREITLRSYVLIDGKDLSIVGEKGTVLDGGTGVPATAIGVHRSSVTLRQLEITGFRYDVEEDDTYEGHGIFVIDGKARID